MNKYYKPIDVKYDEGRYFTNIINTEECWNCGVRISNKLAKCPRCETPNESFTARFMIRNRESTFKVGMEHPRARVTDEGAQLIRALYKNRDDLTQQDLAKEFNLNQTTISLIITNKRRWSKKVCPTSK